MLRLKPDSWSPIISSAYGVNLISSTRVRHRFGSWDEMRWSPYIDGLWLTRKAGWPCLSQHHRGWWNEMKKWMRWVWRNSLMKFVAGENGKTPIKTYPDPVSSTTKPTWSDRDANSGSQRWEASDSPLAPRSRLQNKVGQYFVRYSFVVFTWPFHRKKRERENTS